MPKIRFRLYPYNKSVESRHGRDRSGQHEFPMIQRANVGMQQQPKSEKATVTNEQIRTVKDYLEKKENGSEILMSELFFLGSREQTKRMMHVLSENGIVEKQGDRPYVLKNKSKLQDLSLFTKEETIGSFLDQKIKMPHPNKLLSIGYGLYIEKKAGVEGEFHKEYKDLLAKARVGLIQLILIQHKITNVEIMYNGSHYQENYREYLDIAVKFYTSILKSMEEEGIIVASPLGDEDIQELYEIYGFNFMSSIRRLPIGYLCRYEVSMNRLTELKNQS